MHCTCMASTHYELTLRWPHGIFIGEYRVIHSLYKQKHTYAVHAALAQLCILENRRSKTMYLEIVCTLKSNVDIVNQCVFSLAGLKQTYSQTANAALCTSIIMHPHHSTASALLILTSLGGSIFDWLLLVSHCNVCNEEKTRSCKLEVWVLVVADPLSHTYACKKNCLSPTYPS